MDYISKASDIRRWQASHMDRKKKPEPKPNDIELEYITNKIGELCRSGNDHKIIVPKLCEYNEIKLKEKGYKIKRIISTYNSTIKHVVITWEPNIWNRITDIFAFRFWD